MPRGGSRPGAGRKAHTPNKATQARQAMIAESGITPLDYLIGVMRDDEATRPERLDAAKAAAPYVHPRLSQVDANVKGEFDVRSWMVNAQSAAEDGES